MHNWCGYHSPGKMLLTPQPILLLLMTVCTMVVVLIQPSVIYLDEPTSGLDSSMALRITKMLKGICSRGSRTVCMTIHQPSIKVYDCMDEVMFLHKGRILYKDSSHGVVNYMKKKFDVAVPDFANCAELFLEYVAEHEEDGDFETNLTCDDSEHFPMTERGSSIIPDRRASIDKPRKLRTYTRSLVIYLLYIASLSTIPV